jgi:signal peptidase
MKMMKIVFKIIKYILISILVFLAIIYTSVFIKTKLRPDEIPTIFGYKPFVVMSGSMETELYKGDLAIIKVVDKNTLNTNDIIAFREKKDLVVTHRIVEIQTQNGEKVFITKGDNNNSNDTGVVHLKDIEGKYVKKYSSLGNIVLILQKPITLIIILSIILVFGIIWIALDDNKLTEEERQELEDLRRENEKLRKEKRRLRKKKVN